VIASSIFPQLQVLVPPRDALPTSDGLIMVLQKPIFSLERLNATPRRSIRTSPAAIESFRTAVSLLVPLLVVVLSKRFAALGKITKERTVAGMLALVTVECRAPGEAFWA
jgi:hypothetical protein